MQDEAITGSITREDAAAICVRALSRPPQQALIFEVLTAAFSPFRSLFEQEPFSQAFWGYKRYNLLHVT